MPPWLSYVLLSARTILHTNHDRRLAIATNPDPSLISWSLQHGADLEKAGVYGTTSLSTAVASAPFSSVQTLL